MIRKVLVFSFNLSLYFNALSQPITLPKLYFGTDTTRQYYLSFCEQYYDLFDRHYYNYLNFDTCRIDFTKYDLVGIRKNDDISWELVSPKKYIDLSYRDLYHFDTLLTWNLFLLKGIIEDTIAYNELKKRSKEPLKDTFDFNKTSLIYHDVWIDCHGRFYYKIQYDPVENIIICNLIEIYGGCHGSLPTDSWIAVPRPKPDAKIVLKRIWVN